MGIQRQPKTHQISVARGAKTYLTQKPTQLCDILELCACRESNPKLLLGRQT
jgi:hypothetical protein